MTPERKVVVITGASRGIGAQLSKAYRHIGYQGDRPEIWGIMLLWQRPGLHWRSGQIDAQTRHRGCRCRLRNELGAADRRHFATIASAGTWGASGSLGWPGRTEGQTVIWPHEARVTPEILMLPASGDLAGGGVSPLPPNS